MPGQKPPPPNPPVLDRRTLAKIAEREHQFSIVGRTALIGAGLGLIIVALVLGIDDVQPSDSVKKIVIPDGVASEKTEVSREPPKGIASVIPKETTLKMTFGVKTTEETVTTKSHQFESTETLLAIGALGAFLMLAGVLRLKSFEFAGAKGEFDASLIENILRMRKTIEEATAKAAERAIIPQRASAADLADVLTKATLAAATARDAAPEELPAIAEEILRKVGL